MDEPILGGSVWVTSPGRVEQEVISSVQPDRIKAGGYWILKEDGDWVIPGKELPYLVSFQPRVSLTGIPELDYQLLLSMEYPELLNTCQTNSYYRQICKDENLWKEKLNRDYPGMIEIGLPDESYREQYEALYKKNPVEAVRRDRLYLLIYLKSIGGPLDQKLVDEAVSGDRLQILKWLITNGLTLTGEHLPLAIEKGHLGIAEYLVEQGYFPLEEYYALVVGSTSLDFNREIADWLYQLGVIPLDWRIEDYALKDKIYFLDWLKSVGFVFNQVLINQIMFNSADRATEWLLQNRMPPSQNIIDNMVWLEQTGTLYILQRYHYDLSPIGYLFCIFTDNLILFKRMIEDRVEPYPGMIQYAILLNRPRFLREYGPDYTLTDRLYAELVDFPRINAIVLAEAPEYTPGMLEVKRGKYPQEKITPFHADLAMAYGHSKLVREFASIGVYPTNTGYTAAAIKGYFWAIEFMISRNHQPDELMLFMALEFDRSDMIMYMVQHQIGLSVFLLDVAAAYDKLDLLKWLVQNHNLIPSSVGTTLAMMRGLYDTMRYIIEVDPWRQPSYHAFKYPIIWGDLPRDEFIKGLKEFKA